MIVPKLPAMIAPSAMTARDLLAGLGVGLDAVLLDRIAGQSALRRLRRGDAILREGETGAIVGHVIEGTLGIVRELEQGRPHILGLLLPGDAFGRPFGGPMPYAVEALTDAVVLCSDRATMAEALNATPAAAEAAITSMLAELDAARAWALALSNPQVAARTASFLAILERRQRRGGSASADDAITLRLPLARRDLARALGVTAESLSRALHRLEKSGLIEVVAPNILRVLGTLAPADVAGSGTEQPDAAPGRAVRRLGGRWT